MQKYIRVGQKLSKLKLNGISLSDFSIYVPAYGAFKGPCNAPEPIQKAARILQSYLYRLTDIRLPIYMDSYPLRTKGKIFVGGCYEDGAEKKTYNEDEYDFRLIGDSLYFDGGKRGILYAVYDFLEMYLGFRYFTSDVEKILYSPKIELHDFHHHFLPAFEYRELCDPNAWDPEFSVKSKLNGNFVRRLRKEDGGSVGFAGGFDGLVHTFSKLVKPSKYLVLKPELYAYDGKVRNPNGLCFSNPETLETIVKEALEWLDQEKEPSLLSISINDANMTYCRCPKCQERLNQGCNDTDLYLDFVNRVSEKIHETYPSVQIEALIYHEMVVLPNKIKPNPDIVIRYCPPATRGLPIEEAAALYQKTKDPLLEPSFRTVETIQKWAKMTEKMYIWDYPYNYFSSNVIFPVWPSLLDNMHFFYAHHAKGMYINGQGDHASFNELTTYLLAKLMANPTMSEAEYNTHLLEFLEGYYGEGYLYVRSYMELCLRLSKPYFTTFASPLEIIPEENSKRYLELGEKFLKQAYSLASSKGEEDRIAKLQLTLSYYDLLVNQEKAYASKDEQLIEEYVRKYKKLYRESLRLGVCRICENVFLPVVKNFRQPISETFFWEMQGKAYEDRNNERYARKLYLLIPVEGELGETKQMEILCRTNNENPRGYLSTYLHGAFVSASLCPKWNEEMSYEPISLKGTITNAYEISQKFKMPLDGLFLCFVPVAHKGIMVEVHKMDPGAYIVFKEIEKEA